MSISERFKTLRKIKKLSQTEFGERVGVSRSVIKKIENELVEPKELFIKQVCKEYRVNFMWLTEGEGEMFEPRTRSEIIAQFAGELMKEEDSSFRKQLVEVLAELDLQEWKLLEGIAKKLAKKD